MNNRHSWPLKKSKPWGPFWSYQLNSTANSAYLAHFCGRILIFLIAVGADFSIEVKNIEMWVPTFFKHNNSSVATVSTIALYIYRNPDYMFSNLLIHEFCTFDMFCNVVLYPLLHFLKKLFGRNVQVNFYFYWLFSFGLFCLKTLRSCTVYMFLLQN